MRPNIPRRKKAAIMYSKQNNRSKCNSPDQGFDYIR